MKVRVEEGPPLWRSPHKLAIAAACVVFISGLETQSSFSIINSRELIEYDQLSTHAETSLRSRDFEGVKPRSDKSSSVNLTGPQFVFFAGLEGTGHHTLQAAYKTSPASQVVEALNLTAQLRKLESLLFSPTGLFYEHCGIQGADKFDVRCGDPQDETREACLLRNAKDLMSSIRKALIENDFGQVHVPLNIMRIRASYPDGIGNCRPIKYPSLDHLYGLCDHASVPCRHVYVLRDPFFIERSTVQKRPYNTDETEALQLHVTMLNVLFAQMQAHSDKLLGCIELLPVIPPSETIHKYDSNSAAESSSSSRATSIPSAGETSLPGGALSDIHFSYQQLVTWFGWPPAQTLAKKIAYQTVLQKSVVRPPSPRLIEEDVVPPELRVHLSSVLRSHDAMVQLCS